MPMSVDFKSGNKPSSGPDAFVSIRSCTPIMPSGCQIWVRRILSIHPKYNPPRRFRDIAMNS